MRCHVLFRDMNVPVSRRVGQRAYHGAQFAVHVTMRCLASPGPRQPRAAHKNGTALLIATQDKELKYHDFVAGNRCPLVVVAVETGGRWTTEVVDFVSALAGAQARDALPLLRRSLFLAWRRRWSRMLAVSFGRAFASSLVTSCTVTLTPDLADLFAYGSCQLVVFNNVDEVLFC